MQDKFRMNEQLVNELAELRQRIAELEKSQKELRQAEEKYRNIFENCMEGIYQTSPEGRFINANSTAASLLGYDSPEDLINSVTDIGTQVYAYPEDREKAIKLLTEHGAFENFEMKCRKKDGSIVWGSLTSRLVRDDHGNILYIEGTSQDITERKLNDEILNNMAEGVCLVQTDEGVIAYANPRFEQMFGYGPGELMGRRVSVLNAPNTKDPEDTAKDIMVRLNTIGFWSGDVRNIKKDGTVFWCRVNVSTFDHPAYGNVWISVHEDTTQRKQMEEVLRENEEKYRSLVEHAYDAILIADFEGNVLEANKKAEDLFGYAKEELFGINISQIHPEEELARVVRAFKEMVEGKIDFLLDTKVLRKDRTTVPVDISGGAVGYGGKQVALGIFRDITDRKKMEEYLQDYQSRLEKLVDERTKELSMKSISLEEVNVALKVLLEQREKDKTELEDKIVFNVRKLILPYVDSLKQRKLDDEQRTYLDVLETNLKNIISPFAKKLTSIHETFTPQELKIADLIRAGKTVKEIALAFGVSETTINAHRQHIRNKLGLSNQKINLRTYLLSLAE
jgi:PAS domain S-box-containing protein